MTRKEILLEAAQLIAESGGHSCIAILNIYKDHRSNKKLRLKLRTSYANFYGFNHTHTVFEEYDFTLDLRLVRQLMLLFYRETL